MPDFKAISQKSYRFISLKFVILRALRTKRNKEKQGASLLNKGIYCLIIKLNQGRNIKVGRLGSFLFISGFYVYVGSAQNNLTQRIERHLRRKKKVHWHIDYLLQYGRVVGIRKYSGKKQEECALSRKLEKIKGTMILVKGFGSSDCSCISHLHFFPDDPSSMIPGTYLAEQ
ncbi:MAG: GIY-YIG nuclease family protein [Planctomycetota bacterium]